MTMRNLWIVLLLGIYTVGVNCQPGSGCGGCTSSIPTEQPACIHTQKQSEVQAQKSKSWWCSWKRCVRVTYRTVYKSVSQQTCCKERGFSMENGMCVASPVSEVTTVPTSGLSRTAPPMSEVTTVPTSGLSRTGGNSGHQVTDEPDVMKSHFPLGAQVGIALSVIGTVAIVTTVTTIFLIRRRKATSKAKPMTSSDLHNSHQGGTSAVNPAYCGEPGNNDHDSHTPESSEPPEPPDHQYHNLGLFGEFYAVPDKTRKTSKIETEINDLDNTGNQSDDLEVIDNVTYG